MQEKSGAKIELNAAIVAVAGHEPQVLVNPPAALPSGPFETEHRTLEQGLRDWAAAKGGQPLGYVEQLYTFADRSRAIGNQRIVSIGYLALVRAAASSDAVWSPWYKHFPWEDHRKGAPKMIASVIAQELKRWKDEASSPVLKRERAQRIDVAFPKDMKHWNEELVLQRYELLWEAGLVEEAKGRKSPFPLGGKGWDGGATQSDDPPSAKTKGLLTQTQVFASSPQRGKDFFPLGMPMEQDHRRILATAIARLRAKIKYRPVVFELMPDNFTLLQLQNTVEALAGLRLHKQNFRRLVEGQGLVEETGAVTRGASGRPAKLFAFRREVLVQRAASGTKLPRT